MQAEIFKYMDEIRTKELIGETKRRLTEKVAHYTTMPTPTAAMAGEVVQYIGATDANYVRDDFYRAVYDATDGGAWVKASYNKEEIDELISAAGHFVIVPELPLTDIKTNVIYLVPKVSVITGYYDGTENDPVYVPDGSDFDKYEFDSDLSIYIFTEVITGTDADDIRALIDDDTYSETSVSAESRESNNIKTEYINLDGTSAGWEKIGDTAIDLSDYVRSEDLVPITSAELAAMWEDD